jgi:hypothetical protein
LHAYRREIDTATQRSPIDVRGDIGGEHAVTDIAQGVTRQVRATG